MFFINTHHGIYFATIIFVAGGILFLLFYLKIRNILNNRIARKRTSTSKRAEKRAEKWLKRNGFQIIEKQQGRPLVIQEGKNTHRYLIRTDFLVKKGIHRYIVEVKSGQKNNSVTNRDTRRQLLEYYLAYPGYGIILFDMENKKFSEVKFSLPDLHSRQIKSVIFFLLGSLLTLVIIYFLQQVQ